VRLTTPPRKKKYCYETSRGGQGPPRAVELTMMMMNIIILWDHCLIGGPSLTETSLCGAYLYWGYAIAKRPSLLLSSDLLHILQAPNKSVSVWTALYCISCNINISVSRCQNFALCAARYLQVRLFFDNSLCILRST
jgi:hypothetical protein